jgi:hypothetical protein
MGIFVLAGFLLKFWEFLLSQTSTSTLWFGRSFMGHRSLLFHPPTTKCPSLCISSVPFSDFYLQNVTTKEEIKENNNNSVEVAEEEEKENNSVFSSWTEIPTNELYSMTCNNITDDSITVTIVNNRYTTEE